METVKAHIGVDLGQARDYTAICVAEIEERGGIVERDECGREWRKGSTIHYNVRYLERLPLGTSYPDVVKRLVEIQQRLMERGAFFAWWVDASGVGKPVVDMLRQAGVQCTPTYLTGGDQSRTERGNLYLAKALLVSRLKVLLSTERVHLPNTPEAAALTSELLNFEIRVDEAAQATFGAFRVGSHDDLATALGLACWNEPITGKIFF
jgi:hypothetical protein